MNRLDTFLAYLEGVTAVIAAVPSPASVPAALALQIEKIFRASLQAHAASSGQTVEEVIAKLHKIEPIP